MRNAISSRAKFPVTDATSLTPRTTPVYEFDTPADKAALLAHAHDNKCVLDSLDRDESGRLTIGGQPVDDGGRDTVTADSLGEDIPAMLRDGGLLILIQEEE